MVCWGILRRFQREELFPWESTILKLWIEPNACCTHNGSEVDTQCTPGHIFELVYGLGFIYIDAKTVESTRMPE
jgi:hypothetical protein